MDQINRVRLRPPFQYENTLTVRVRDAFGINKSSKKGARPDDPETEPLRQRIHALRNGTTGSLVTFYDAVPASGEKDLLETDLLNPHYPEFYRDPAHNQPSDDQNPIPVYFLAVRSGAVFEFPFRVTAWREVEPWRDEPERQRAAALGDTTPAQIQDQVRGWLTDGLKLWGAGAKTAAGYGYFDVVTEKSRK